MASSPSRKKQRTAEEQDSATDKVVLHSYWRSSCSWRVRIALAWKGIDYEYKAVHLVKAGGEQFQEAFTKLNPNQRVPLLEIDGHVISQSGAMLEYLEETRPERPLLPSDAFQRAQVRNLCLLIGADIQPIQNLGVLIKAAESAPEDERATKKLAWGKYWVERGFTALEQELASTSGKFCFGDDVTLADLYLEPQLYNASRFGVDMTAFPIISRISASLAELPEFKAAIPSEQPDAQ